MDIAEITSRIREAVKDGSELGGSLKVDFGKEGKIFHDGDKEVTNADSPADATIKVSMENFIRLAKRQIDPTIAFMQGKIKIEGDVAVALKLQTLLDHLD